MSLEENAQTAQEGYAAFGRGDVPAILELLTDDIEWIEPGPPDVIPAAGTYRGKEEVGRLSRRWLRRLETGSRSVSGGSRLITPRRYDQETR
jgi:ketosteroid isomerase-like protein